MKLANQYMFSQRVPQFDVCHNLHHHHHHPRRHHHYDADDLWSDSQTQLHMPFRTSGPQVIGDCQLNLHISYQFISDIMFSKFSRPLQIHDSISGMVHNCSLKA